MQRYRLGVVSYLNTKPLIDHLERSPHPQVELVSDVPSRLVALLRAGELDAALVSSIACLEDERLVIIANTGIACRGGIDSIRLFCRVDPTRVKRVALDSSSRTSVALARILLAECFGANPEAVDMPPDLGPMLAAADAALLIGDPALRAFHVDPGPRAGLQVLDLGEVWHALTGLPFVFAVWAAPRNRDPGPLPELLAEAREAGKPRLDAIADAAAARLGLPRAACRNYLRNLLVLDLGAEELAGLRRFRELAIRHGLLPPGAPLPRMLDRREGMTCASCWQQRSC